jgi:hypothetical protein
LPLTVNKVFVVHTIIVNFDFGTRHIKPARKFAYYMKNLLVTGI